MPTHYFEVRILSDHHRLDNGIDCVPYTENIFESSDTDFRYEREEGDRGNIDCWQSVLIVGTAFVSCYSFSSKTVSDVWGGQLWELDVFVFSGFRRVFIILLFGQYVVEYLFADPYFF